MAKNLKVCLTMSLTDAETLQGLLDGCRGTSDDDNFSDFATRLLATLDKNVKKIYIDKKKSTNTKLPKPIFLNI